MSNRKKQPLFDNEGARVCADHERRRRYGQADLIVMFDDFGHEIGSEAEGARDLYAAPSEEFAIYGDNVRIGRAALDLQPPKGAGPAERRRFYELQKAALGVNTSGRPTK